MRDTRIVLETILDGDDGLVTGYIMIVFRIVMMNKSSV